MPLELTRLFEAHGEAAEAAWTDFLTAYSRLLLGAAAASAAGYDDILDRYTYILDELRCQDYRRLRRFAADTRCRFSTWLSVVAKRLCVDHHRRRYGRPRRGSGARPIRSPAAVTRRGLRDLAGGSPELLDRVQDPSTVDPVEALDSSERRAALARALARLGADDRVLVALRYDENLTAREIADRLGLPTPFHVYRRLTAVCERLRCELESQAARPVG